MKLKTVLTLTLTVLLQLFARAQTGRADLGQPNPRAVSPRLEGNPSAPSVSFIFTNAPGYAVFVSTTNFVGGTLTVTWDTPNPFTSLLDKVELYRTAGTNWILVESKFTTLNRLETFTVTETGIYEVRYAKFFPREVKAKSPFIFVGQKPPPAPAGEVATFGDSYAQQIAPVLERRLGTRVHNLGVPGETTRAIRSRLPALLAVRPTAVVVSGGSNDLFNDFGQGEQVTHQETIANLDFIFSALQSRGVTVIYLGVFEGFFPFRAGDYRAVTEKHGVVYIPDILSGIAFRPSLMADEVHPSELGYEVIIERFEPSLRLVLSGRDSLTIGNAGGAIVLSWFAQTNRTYSIQSADILGVVNWTNRAEIHGMGTRTNLVLPKSGQTGFYRLLAR